MSSHYWEKEWLDIVARQEEALKFTAFDRDDALQLGLSIVNLAREKYKDAVAIRIIEDGYTIFAYKMPGRTSENDWWMDRKLALSRLTGVSSMRAFMEAEAGIRPAVWDERTDNLALCGGCFPVLIKDGSPTWAYVLVSGLQHYDDHQIIADAMAAQLGVSIPELRAHRQS